jgi:hypothetical protein
LSGGAFLGIIYALVILAFAAAMTIFIESYLLRALGLLVLAGITYLILPLAISYQDKLYLNGLIVEFVATFILLILFESGLTEEKQTFIPMLIFVIIIAAIFLNGFGVFEREMEIDIAVMLLGAFMVTAMLNREWWWEGRARAKSRELDDELTGFTDADFGVVAEQADVLFKLTGRSEDELDHKLQGLKATIEILGGSDDSIDKKSGAISRYVAAKVKQRLEQDAVQRGRLEVSFRGEVDLVRTAVRRLGDLFEVYKRTKRDSPFRGEIIGDLEISVPQQGLSDILFEHFRDLGMNWRNSAQEAKAKADAASTDPRQKAYYEGIARANQQAAAQLLARLDEFEI